MVFPYWNCNCHLELCHYWNGHSIATYQFWMWYQQFWLTTHLFKLGLRLALPARLQAFSASWKMWRLRWQPSMLIPIFNGKNGKMIYEWRRFYWHVGLVEGFLRVKISMSTQQHGVRTNRDMSIAQRNAGFMYLSEYGDISIPLLVVVATLLHFKYWIRKEPDQPLVLALTSSRIFTALDSSKAVLVPDVRHRPKPWDVTVEIKEEKLAIHLYNLSYLPI